ncbi:Heme-degrading monooxygenase HmoA [Flavobacteriaceae bacterium MAR_2010_188]|nr:Heme-degrading monooxygenase HmoA [Flavobacteriaceae bacterium MAR_2010_188]
MVKEFKPYYAVIFTSKLNAEVIGYQEMSILMEELATQQSGYLGIESARSEIGITVSYWQTLEDINNWKQQSDHLVAQKLGREKWYCWYEIKICKVEREYSFNMI